MSKTMKIAVVTGARSDFGLMSMVLREIMRHDGLELQLMVTGMHLSPEFGQTEQQIVAEGFPIAARIETLLSSNSGVGIAKSIGLGTLGFADALASLQPDLLLLFGDRFETFAAAQAAMAMGIAIAHVHGGEVSEGAIDEQMRHCISKMARLHLVSAAAHRDRLIRMGEQPDSIRVVGAPGLDHFAGRSFLTRDEIAARLAHPIGEQLLLVTYHPATLGDLDPVVAFAELTCALDQFETATVIMTMPNADAGGRGLVESARRFAAERPERVILVTSLGQELYLSALVRADAVVGNSSSGLIEAPAAGTPTVNIGDRQRGRLRGDTVIDCGEEREAIASAISRVLSPAMQALAARRISPYGEPGGIATAIVDAVAAFDPTSVRRKTFFDG
jgi:UDP-hydrolysing UDP-N-acetyl-D-glucosamine 2-epimerase